jgi:hypothetical protein
MESCTTFGDAEIASSGLLTKTRLTKCAKPRSEGRERTGGNEAEVI